MSAAELLINLTSQGFTLAADGYGIRIRPASRLSPEVRQAIVANRAELLTAPGGQNSFLPPLWDAFRQQAPVLALL
jgi:hypothetical protein